MSDPDFHLLPRNKLYKKEKTNRLKNFPAGYMGSFYGNLADNVDNFVGSDLYSRIATDSDIPTEDVQKCILATSDFAKCIQTDINHYVTRDRINDASFRQKLDPIRKNISKRQNPLELVFEDISTFDAENSIVGSLLREIDLNKQQTDSDFIEFLPSHPGKEFEIQKRLDKLRDIKRFEIIIITIIIMMMMTEVVVMVEIFLLPNQYLFKIIIICLSQKYPILTIYLTHYLRSTIYNKG